MSSGNTISISYGLILFATTLEFLGLPFPRGILVAVAGATLARGNLRLIPLICVAAVGAVAGETPWYFLGRFGSNRLLHLYCKFTLGSRTCVRIQNLSFIGSEFSLCCFQVFFRCEIVCSSAGGCSRLFVPQLLGSGSRGRRPLGKLVRIVRQNLWPPFARSDERSNNLGFDPRSSLDCFLDSGRQANNERARAGHS